ncbi:MAG: cell division protein FtsL [Elusimicrobia bacterium]|nr:cell division protein FtsL [Elusimicrobiota bacterium]
MQLKKHKAKLKYILLLLAVVFFLSSKGFRSLVKNYLEYRRLHVQKLELAHEEVQLKKEFKAIKEPANVERTARKDLGMKRPDEIEYRFTPPSEKDK